MIDKSKRYVRTYVPLGKLEILQGRKIEFDSIAEMFLTRVRENPGYPLVYFYDDVIPESCTFL
jgi:long-chain acyl-CoA synthetase